LIAIGGILDSGKPSARQTDGLPNPRPGYDRDVERTIRDVAANLLRVIRGAGKPHELLLQMKSVIDASGKFQQIYGHWPPSHIFAGELHLKSEDEEYWEAQRQGRYTNEQVERRLADGEHERILAEHTIQRGALQMIASALIGQNTQQIAGEGELYEGLRDWAKNRKERLERRREAERAAARAATASKIAPPKKALAKWDDVDFGSAKHGGDPQQFVGHAKLVARSRKRQALQGFS
jgi:hypothetical protein